MHRRTPTNPATHHPSNFSINGENSAGKNKRAKKMIDAHINVTRILDNMSNDWVSPHSAEEKASSLANFWFFIKRKNGKKTAASATSGRGLHKIWRDGIPTPVPCLRLTRRRTTRGSPIPPPPVRGGAGDNVRNCLPPNLERVDSDKARIWWHLRAIAPSPTYPRWHFRQNR